MSILGPLVRGAMANVMVQGLMDRQFESVDDMAAEIRSYARSMTDEQLSAVNLCAKQQIQLWLWTDEQRLQRAMLIALFIHNE